MTTTRVSNPISDRQVQTFQTPSTTVPDYYSALHAEWGDKDLSKYRRVCEKDPEHVERYNQLCIEFEHMPDKKNIPDDFRRKAIEEFLVFLEHLREELTH